MDGPKPLSRDDLGVVVSMVKGAHICLRGIGGLQLMYLALFIQFGDHVAQAHKQFKPNLVQDNLVTNQLGP